MHVVTPCGVLQFRDVPLPLPLLQGVLNVKELSVQLASLLPSPDVKMAVLALQLAETLMQKLPEVCTSHFRREGIGIWLNQVAGTACLQSIHIPYLTLPYLVGNREKEATWPMGPAHIFFIM